MCAIKWRFIYGVVTPILIAVAACTEEPKSQSTVTTDGIVAYLGVAPSTVVVGHPSNDEQMMHGGPSEMPGAMHVMLALFDAANGERIENATIDAVVTPSSGAGIAKPLEPMMEAQALTYGNYFNMARPGSYEITAKVNRPGIAHAVMMNFYYWRDPLLNQH